VSCVIACNETEIIVPHMIKRDRGASTSSPENITFLHLYHFISQLGERLLNYKTLNQLCLLCENDDLPLSERVPN